MCETEHESSYFTFPKDFKKQCSCDSKENVYYFCTYYNCPKFGLICSLCMFYEHLNHASYCVPIQLYKIEKLKTNWMTNLKKTKEYLIQKKEEINKMLDEQIRFIEEIEKASEIEELLQLNAVPKYSNYPKIVNRQHTIENIDFLVTINNVVHKKNKDLQSKIEEIITELKQNYLDGKFIQILNRNPIKFESFSDYYPREFKFSFKSKEPFYLKGIGYSSEMTESLKSYGYISVQEKENQTYLLETKSMSSNQLKFSSLPNITFTFFDKYLKISKDIEYVVSIDYRRPEDRNYNRYSQSSNSKTVVWMRNLKYDSMEFNISAGNQSGSEYVSHLFIM